MKINRGVKMRIFTLCKDLGKQTDNLSDFEPNFTEGEFILIWDDNTQKHRIINSEVEFLNLKEVKQK